MYCLFLHRSLHSEFVGWNCIALGLFASTAGGYVLLNWLAGTMYSELVGWNCIDCIVIVSGQNGDDSELVNDSNF